MIVSVEFEFVMLIAPPLAPLVLIKVQFVIILWMAVLRMAPPFPVEVLLLFTQ